MLPNPDGQDAPQGLAVDALQDEAIRLFELPGPALGQELLRRVREVSEAWPAAVADQRTASAIMLERIVPAVAAHLAALTTPPSARRPDLSQMPPDGLRHVVATLLRQRPLAELAAERGAAGWMALRLLTREVAAGNPLAFALDRLAPPGSDWMAGEVRAAALRHHQVSDGRWCPALL